MLLRATLRIPAGDASLSALACASNPGLNLTGERVAKEGRIRSRVAELAASYVSARYLVSLTCVSYFLSLRE